VLQGEDGRVPQVLFVVACFAFSPVLIVLLAIALLHFWVHSYSRRAIWEWALTEYGSDHLPVCVRLNRDRSGERQH